MSYYSSLTIFVSNEITPQVLLFFSSLAVLDKAGRGGRWVHGWRCVYVHTVPTVPAPLQQVAGSQ